MPARYGGGSFTSRQTRTTVRASTVSPDETCNVSAKILRGGGKPSKKKPVHKLKMMKVAIAQCRAIATRV